MAKKEDDFYNACIAAGIEVKESEKLPEGIGAVWVPRLKAPSTTDKNWIHYTAGGYNYCIKIYGNSCLPNCFAGETEYVTNEGLKTFKDTVGTTQMVLNENGEFVPAEIKSFGVQKLYKVTLNKGEPFYATDNHRWVIEKKSQWKDKKYTKRIIKTTLELKPKDHIPYNYFVGNDVMDINGIQHGIVFGDGKKHQNSDSYELELFGNKKELEKFISRPIHSHYNLKEIPPITETEEYLRGFVAGWLATDGCVTKDTFSISNVEYSNIKKLESICYRLGIHIGKIRQETRDKTIGKYYYPNHTMYFLTFRRKGIEKLLIKESDKAKISSTFKDITTTTVKSVEETDRIEEVYCAVEPETHTITLRDNILTGQCVGYAWGRWRELLGKKHNLSCSDAERWYGKNDGYKRGTTPKLGAVICWRKGRADTDSDGMGHVAIVEKINADGSITCSNSAYYSTRFWLSTHKPPYHFSGYTFQGFIYNPINYDVNPGKLDVDGEFGVLSIKATQKWLGTTQDGIISDQNKSIKTYAPAILSYDLDGGGSAMIRTFQKYLKKNGFAVTVNGYVDKQTVIAWQKWLNRQGYPVDVDGYFGEESAMAMQKFLNRVL